MRGRIGKCVELWYGLVVRYVACGELLASSFYKASAAGDKACTAGWAFASSVPGRNTALQQARARRKEATTVSRQVQESEGWVLSKGAVRIRHLLKAARRKGVRRSRLSLGKLQLP